VLLSTIEGRGINLSGGSTEDKSPEQKKSTSTRNIAFDDHGSLSKITKQVKENGTASGAPAVPATGENTRSEIAVSGEPGSKGTSEEKSSLSLPDTLIKQDIGSKRPAKEVKRNTNKRGAYAGVLLGPDFSAVQSSKSKGVGYSAGLIVGYNFSNSISLETGIYWDRKRYATTGKNFSTAKFNWPSHTNLLSISGYCDMIEIPLTVRFKHKAGNSGNVFAAAGASSYIMKKEDYQYKTERYGLYYSGKKSYANGSTHLMPVVHFSAGYERTLGGIGNIRIEPYLKLPVAGVGIGDMSLKSAGVYLGITRSIR
ncbi:MAG TPA: outer membrane beta-barrel protein, partial [Chitinophagaceae bacterium]|nr:outer membrane beta-barrel protein [Chitinophagaceae bacterium]